MKQLTNSILMVRPANFGFNEQTATNNAFQTKITNENSEDLKHIAKLEFDEMVALLRSKGINVIVVEDTEFPIKPDALFPNNWVSFHENGAVITYPMYAQNRRVERREEIIEGLSSQFLIKNRYSFEFYEDEENPQFLEGTGSMIFDRPNRIVYACLSERTDAKLIDKFNVLMDTDSILFHSVDKSGVPIYHTNVMMALGEDFVVICLESIPNENEKKKVLDSFAKTGKEVIDISLEQVNLFCGNMLEVTNNIGRRYLCMSQTSYDALDISQRNQLALKTNLLPIKIPHIEKFGGGSVRCMMAEIFLPKK